MWKNSFPVIAMLLMVSACAGQHKHVDTNPPFTPHQYSSHDLGLNWQSVQTDTGIRIAGTVSNMRYLFPYNSLELTAEVLDSHGNVLGKGSEDYRAWFMGSDTFNLDIPVERKDQAERVRFTYSYEKEADTYFLRHFQSLL